MKDRTKNRLKAVKFESVLTKNRMKSSNKREDLKSKSLRSNKIRNMAYISIFSGISVMLYMFLKFKLPFFPPWLEVNLSMLPIFLIIYLLGYKEALVVVVIRFLFKITSTETAFIGETADIIIGLSTVLASGLYFSKTEKNNKNLLISLVVGIIAWTIAGSLTNTFMLIPWYLTTYNLSLDNLASSLQYLYSGINGKNFMLYYNLFGVIPFNIMLGSIVSIITYIVAKRINVVDIKSLHK